MTFRALLSLVGTQPFFDLAAIVQLSGGSRAALRIQLFRWTGKGMILSLRRGMYTLAEQYRRIPLNPAELANYLHRPSYLSGLWALGFYGLIPEKVVTWTSVTSREPRLFENAFGVFEYRHIKQNGFFGYRAVDIQGRKVMLAEPEKALLDFWHMNKGPWGKARMGEMRFQNRNAVDQAKLEEYAGRYKSPRLSQAAQVWRSLADEEIEGAVDL